MTQLLILLTNKGSAQQQASVPTELLAENSVVIIIKANSNSQVENSSTETLKPE